MSIISKLLTVFSQKQLKDYFYYKMNSEELKKIEQLDVDEVKVKMSGYQFSFINGIGYILIRKAYEKGYIIMPDGYEEARYFECVFCTQSSEKAKKEIDKFLNQSKK